MRFIVHGKVLATGEMTEITLHAPDARAAGWAAAERGIQVIRIVSPGVPSVTPRRVEETVARPISVSPRVRDGMRLGSITLLFVGLVLIAAGSVWWFNQADGVAQMNERAGIYRSDAAKSQNIYVHYEADQAQKDADTVESSQKQAMAAIVFGVVAIISSVGLLIGGKNVAVKGEGDAVRDQSQRS